jgi:hypothetical protein
MLRLILVLFAAFWRSFYPRRALLLENLHSASNWQFSNGGTRADGLTHSIACSGCHCKCVGLGGKNVWSW